MIPLRTLDNAMLVVHRELRGIGVPGFKTQTIVSLGAHADPAALRSALDAVARRHPILTSLLSRDGRFWLPREGFGLPLRERDLAESHEACVLAECGRLLGEDQPLERDGAIHFFLLHRPDGRDVFVMQYDHVLMDNGDAMPLLREIRQALRPGYEALPPPKADRPDLIEEHLRRFPLRRRLLSVVRLVRLRFMKLRPGAITVGRGRKRGEAFGPAVFGTASRALSVEATAALEAGIVERCGFPALSMGLLASAFRAVREFAPPEPPRSRRQFIVGLGINVPARGRGPFFQNRPGAMPLNVARGEMGGRDGLHRLLNARLRGYLEKQIELAGLQMGVVDRRFDMGRSRFIATLLRKAYSIWYALFVLDDSGEPFAGAPVEEVFQAASTWPTMGLTLLSTKFQGRLRFTLTYMPEFVAKETAEAFLDWMVADLEA